MSHQNRDLPGHALLSKKNYFQHRENYLKLHVFVLQQSYDLPLDVKQTFHSFTVLSFDPVASQLPSKEKVQHVIYLGERI